MTQSDYTDGWLFIIGGVLFAVCFVAFQVWKVGLKRDMKRYMHQHYGCACGGEFKINEGLSDEQADRLIGQIDGGSLPPRMLNYRCDKCGTTKVRNKDKHQNGPVWAT